MKKINIGSYKRIVDTLDLASWEQNVKHDIRGETLTFENLEFEFRLSLNPDPDRVNTVRYVNCRFLRTTYLTNPIRSIETIGCKFETFRMSNRCTNLLIQGGTIENLLIQNLQFDKFSIHNVAARRIEIKGSLETNEGESLYINNCEVGDMSINALKKGAVLLNHLKATRMDFVNRFGPDSMVKINRGEAKTFLFTDFISAGKFAVNGIVPITIQSRGSEEFTEKSTFGVITSYLKNVEFRSVDFTQWDEFNLTFSYLFGMNLFSVKWPEKLTGFGESNRDYWKQLKNTAQSQGDMHLMRQFSAREKTALYKELTWKDLDKYLLWVGRINRFGLNWMRPLLLNLVVSFGIFCLILGLESLSFTANWVVFLDFLNPLHSPEIFGKNYEMNVCSKVIDFFTRTFQGLMIFQTITAFRKFGK